MGRMAIFLSVLLGFLAGVTALLCYRLVVPMGLSSFWEYLTCGVLVAAVIFMVTSMVGFRVHQGLAKASPFLMGLQEAGYLVMGVLAFVLSFTLCRDLLLFPLWVLARVFHWPGEITGLVWGSHAARAQTLSILALAIIFSVWAMVLCFKPVLTRTKLSYPNLPESLKGLRIGLISDIHVGPWFHQGFVERVVATLQKEAVDILVLAGDVADGVPAHLEQDVAPLAFLKGKLGTFYTTGNHEFYWNAQAWTEHMKSLGYTTLTNESSRVVVGQDTLTVVGLADFQSLSFPGDQKTDFAKAFSGVVPGHGFCLAIIHQPKGIEEAVRRGADLILSGHTHGGQFFPGTLVIKWAQKYVAGLYDLKGPWLYVGRGTGAWGPPMRLGARGEIAVLTLGV